jgi:hypothetical protein
MAAMSRLPPYRCAWVLRGRRDKGALKALPNAFGAREVMISVVQSITRLGEIPHRALLRDLGRRRAGRRSSHTACGCPFNCHQSSMCGFSGAAMKRSSKYSAVAAFFGRTLGLSCRPKRFESLDDKVARLSKETGVSVEALSLFSTISEDDGTFTAEAARSDFEHVKPSQMP